MQIMLRTHRSLVLFVGVSWSLRISVDRWWRLWLLVQRFIQKLIVQLLSPQHNDHETLSLRLTSKALSLHLTSEACAFRPTSKACTFADTTAPLFCSRQRTFWLSRVPINHSPGRGHAHQLTTLSEIRSPASRTTQPFKIRTFYNTSSSD